MVPAGDVAVAYRSLARMSEALSAKEICGFLATLSVANLESGKTVDCHLKDKAITDKSKTCGASLRGRLKKEIWQV